MVLISAHRTLAKPLVSIFPSNKRTTEHLWFELFTETQHLRQPLFGRLQQRYANAQAGDSCHRPLPAHAVSGSDVLLLHVRINRRPFASLIRRQKRCHGNGRL